jgi:AraC family transcriptional regulator of adaptative response / DNA-3-methyladenine glycosylase II
MGVSSLDGWLWQGVVTTKIYCRPSCSARPKPENVRVFESVAATRAAGMRACKRCRPDSVASLVDGPVVRHLAFRAPFDAGALLAFFGARAVPGVEELCGDVFRRSLRLPGGFAVVELRSLGDRVGVRLWLDDPRDEAEAVARVRAMFDLDADPEAVRAALGRDEVMRPLVEAAPGRRVPGCADPDEIAIRAVLGQQVSVAGAATLAGRLVAAYGEPLARPVGSVTHVFPSADALAGAGDSDPADAFIPRGDALARTGDSDGVGAVVARADALAGAGDPGVGTADGLAGAGDPGAANAFVRRADALAGAGAPGAGTAGSLGPARDSAAASGSRPATASASPWAMPASRRHAIRTLAEALASGDVVLDPHADRREVEDRLLSLPGIGPWTVSYIAMRALRDNDAFLATDLGVRHALDRLGLDSRPAAAERLSQSWRPYRAYALQHLWGVAS